MTQIELAQAVMHKIFSYLTEKKEVGPFIVQQPEQRKKTNKILGGFPLQTIKLATQDKNCNELFYLHITKGTKGGPVIHFHRYKNAGEKKNERIYEEQLANIITGTKDKVEIKCSTSMYLRRLPRIINDPREQLLADLADKYPNPYYSGSLDNFKDDVMRDTVTQLMNLCFDKYIVRATLRNELANTI